jgi:hypothetical protein
MSGQSHDYITGMGTGGAESPFSVLTHGTDLLLMALKTEHGDARTDIATAILQHWDAVRCHGLYP